MNIRLFCNTIYQDYGRVPGIKEGKIPQDIQNEIKQLGCDQFYDPNVDQDFDAVCNIVSTLKEELR
jgi:hypothetical protein